MDRPRRVVVPTLLRAPFTWRLDGKHLWGRRLQDEDKDYTLLPSGVFGLIQMNVKKWCDAQKNGSYRIGDGWVHFVEDDINVIACVGGENKRWTDRQWVDIIIAPMDSLHERWLKAEKLLSRMRDTISYECQKACPFMRLTELVINPGDAKAIFTWDAQKLARVLSLEFVKQQARWEGIDYCHNWALDRKSRLRELLMPGELIQLVQSHKDTIESAEKDFKDHVAPLCEQHARKTPGSIIMQRQVSRVPEQLRQEFKDPDNEKLANLVIELFYKQQDQAKEQHQMLQEQLRQLQQRLDASMDQIVSMLETIQHDLRMTGQEILSSCSRMMDSIEVECPKHPHLTEESNLVIKYYPLAGKQARLHYMCEFNDGDGYHPVDLHKYKGVRITVAREWFTEYRDVLMPAVTILFFFARLGKCALPAGGEVVGKVLDVVEGGLQSTFKSCFSDQGSVSRPTERMVTKLFEYVKEQAEYGRQNPPLMMQECFGLYRSGKAWVCDKHRR